MSLIQMSGAAGILILGIVLFRFLFVHRMPKKVMILLWEIAILRLLLPLAISISLPGFLADVKSRVFTEMYSVTAEVFDENYAELEMTEERSITFTEKKEPDWSTAARMIYLLGAAAMLSGSLFLYIRDSRLFREGLPMPEQEKERLIALAAIEDKELLKKIRFQISDRTATPVTYGWIHPAVVFPKGLYLKEEKEVRFCLQHELIHIKNYDNLKKLFAHLALCIHWFNPLVWVMYLLFNRDLELLCDETVVRRSGRSGQDYALTLLSMAEGRSRGFRTGLGFGKSAVKERIVAVMTARKMTMTDVLAAITAVTGALTVFITTNATAYTITEAAFISSENEVQGDVTWDQQVTDVIVTIVTEDDEPWDWKNVEYTVASEAVTGDNSTAEEAELSEDTREFIQGLVDEFGVYGLRAEFAENDYQLYYKEEPVYFFADNKGETSFSGIVAAHADDGTHGYAGAVTERDEDGLLTGLKLLSPEESGAYSKGRW